MRLLSEAPQSAWIQRKFGGNPQIVGTSISLGGDPYTIVGVLGPNFETDPVSDMWLPFQFDLNSQNQGHFFLAAGRLKPGITIDQANAQLKLAAKQFLRRYPDDNPSNGFPYSLCVTSSSAMYARRCSFS